MQPKLELATPSAGTSEEHGEHAAGALHALGIVASAAGEWGMAADLLSQAAELAGGVTADQAVASGLAGDLVEALGWLGDSRSLRVAAAALRVRARATGSQTLAGWAAHAAALAAGSDGDLHAAEHELATARRCAESAGDPFDLARVLVTLGRSQRRLRHPRASRATLERAVRLFVACGAESWAERARSELGRSAGTRGSGTELTAGERRVCERAADGLSNAEIATELYISRRTVEVNLTRAYAKLHIRNRAQLARALADGRDDRLPAGDFLRAVRSAAALWKL